MKRIIDINFIIYLAFVAIAYSLSAVSIFADEGRILFQENFEDTEFASRGWYDHLKGELSTTEHIEGSTASLECKFLIGQRGCVGGSPGRHLFDETDEVYLSYYVKYSENYVGSNKPYHPHEFHFITTENHNYVGPAYTRLTTYIEHNGGVPLLSIQDSENIDESNIGVDLTNITEERSVAGCNGSSDGYNDDCYLAGDVHRNGKQWRADKKYFSDDHGAYYKNDWHHVEAYFKLNSIVAGKGITDGIVRYWFDGEVIIDHDDVMMRTGEHPDMKFNQFLIAPYIGDGSPVEQTMWIDNLTVATSRIASDVRGLRNKIELTLTPNPFSRSTMINYTTDNPSQVSLIVYDALGIEVALLIDEYQDSGQHQIMFRAENLSQGIYYYTIQIGQLTESGKMILVR